MIPKTKAHIPPEIEQEMTIAPPAKRFFGVLVMGVALVLASHLAGFPRLTKPETGQPLAQEAEVNKALIRRVYDEVLNAHNPAVAEALFAPDFRFHGADLPIFSAITYYTPFLGVHYTLEDLVAERDLVVARWQASSSTSQWDGSIYEEQMRGHEGMLGHRSPAVGWMTWSGITIWRIADGQVVESWTNQPGPTFALDGEYSEFGDWDAGPGGKRGYRRMRCRG
jgi:predicted SnoaL-like aldol condensation-catalyzing enzyme